MKFISKKTILHGFLVFSITIFSLFVHGYSFGLGDQVLYLPLLSKLYDSSLYPGDYIFPALYSNKAFIYELLVVLGKSFQGDFFIAYIGMFFMSSFVFYFGIYSLAYTLYKDKRTALVSLFLTLIPYPVAGAAITTIETGFVLRILAHSLVLFALVAVIKKQWFKVLILLALMFVIHPLSAATYSLVIIPLILWYVKPSFKIIAGGILLALAISPVLSTHLSSVKDVILPIISESWWFDIVRLRNSYVIPLDWSVKSWLFLIAILLPLLFTILRNKKSPHQNLWSYRIIIISAVILFIQTIFTSFVPISLVVLLQLGRIWFIPIIVSLIYLAFYIGKWSKKLGLSTNKLVVILLVSFIGIIIFRKNNFIRQQNPHWIATQIWAKEHTSKNCTFLTNFYSQGFRVYSQRPIVGEYKDGTISFYSKDFARKWNERRLYLQMEDSGEFVNSLDNINRRYPFSLVVFNKGITVPLEKMYENEGFIIYKNVELENNCSILL